MKHLCELSKKGIDKNLDKILVSVNEPSFICRKCARVANRKERLCKPVKLSALAR